MSSRNAIQGPTHLDPLFPIPEGLVDYKHGDVREGSVSDFDIEINDGELDYTEVETEDFFFEDTDFEEPPTIDIPNDFEIVSQTIRTLPSGMQVVDLVVEVEDIPGAVNYEFRVVKM